MKYEVLLRETQWGIVEVEAENIDEAGDKAIEAYHDGMTRWTKVDVEVESVMLVSVDSEPEPDEE